MLIMLNLPIGVDDFLDAQNYYYVDKTSFIKNIINSYLSKSILITRPRGFGKSLLLSMVDYYFTIDKDYRYLFQNKEIATAGEKYLTFLNQYPVIHFNMKTVNGNSKEEIIDKCLEEISTLYKKHAYLLNDDLFDIDREYFLNVINKRCINIYDYQIALKKLTFLLNMHYKKKVIVLIDEYDTPLESSYEHNLYEECMPFFKELYSNVLKGNEYLLFSIITGVLQISKESLFSGLNNLEVLSTIDNAGNSYLGFTKSEVETIIKEYELDININELEKWYGGYYFGKTSLFNPWSILNYVSNREIRKYWINTGSNNLIAPLISNNEEVLEIINSNLEVDINNSLSYRDLEIDKNAIYSYLVQTGYLIAKYVDKPNKYNIKIPNLEIYELFKNDIIGRNLSVSTLNIANELKKSFINGEANNICSILEKYIISSFSYFDLKSEQEYKVLLTGILATLFDTHIVKSEVNSKNGRSDIILFPKHKNDIGVIIETKYVNYQLSKNRLQETAKVAITQIQKKKYFQSLSLHECKKIILFGIAFDKRGEHQISTLEI